MTAPAINAAKTHCPSGHPYTEENTYVRPRDGSRHCRECHRVSEMLRRERKPGAYAYCPDAKSIERRKASQRKATRKWEERYPERKKDSDRRSAEKHRERRRQTEHTYYLRNKAKRNAQSREWARRNRDKEAESHWNWIHKGGRFVKERARVFEYRERTQPWRKVNRVLKQITTKLEESP